VYNFKVTRKIISRWQVGTKVRMYKSIIRTNEENQLNNPIIQSPVE
jgi:hypothetical protein